MLLALDTLHPCLYEKNKLCAGISSLVEMGYEILTYEQREEKLCLCTEDYGRKGKLIQLTVYS